MWLVLNFVVFVGVNLCSSFLFALLVNTEKPFLVTSSDNITVDYGETATLIYEVSGNPRPVLIFKLNGRRLQGVELEENGNQTKVTLLVNISSQVECVAENSLGKHRVRTRIIVNSELNDFYFQVI